MLSKSITTRLQNQPNLLSLWENERGSLRIAGTERGEGSVLTNLIFGGAGFIGSNLVRALQTQGQSVVVFDNMQMGNQLSGLDVPQIAADMADSDAVLRVIKDVRPSRIFHLAANSDISASSLDPIFDLDNTLLTTVALSNALRHVDLRPELMFASSSAVYGEHHNAMNESTLRKPVSSYGWMKLASERILESLTKDGFVANCLIARFPNVTGLNQTHGVVYDLVRKLKSNPHELSVLGDGSQLKPYALASELVENILRVFNQPNKAFSVYNFSPHNTVTVREIVTEIIAASGLNPEVVYGSEPVGWAGDINRYELDCSSVELDHGPLLFSNSEEAVKVSARWAWDYLEA